MAKKKTLHIKSKKRFARFLAFLFLLIVLASGLLFLNHLNRAAQPVMPGATESVTIEVASGTTTGGIAELLFSAHLIQDTKVFEWKAKLDHLDGKFKAGVYSFSQAMSMEEIMQALVKGNDATLRFTIPEGYDIKKTTEALVADGLIDAEVFREEIEQGAFSYRFLEGAPAGSERLEGYLFPETYEIFSNADEHAILDKMLSQFDAVFTDEYYARAEELGMSINEVVTLASIIEREAAVEKDRPVISGVFYNRLEAGMALQSCATVQYILGDQKAVLSVADTQIESPYNTYQNQGLPPGPICSPGKASIEAALWPQDSDYLYFLAKGDGSHVFSKTYAEHLRNKAKYID